MTRGRGGAGLRGVSGCGAGGALRGVGGPVGLGRDCEAFRWSCGCLDVFGVRVGLGGGRGSGGSREAGGARGCYAGLLCGVFP